jgi:hypothetical protein
MEPDELSIGESHYDVLGVPTTAARDEIKQAYRAKVKRAHPDAGGDNEQFERLAKAYEVLIDEARRDEHDKELADLCEPEFEVPEEMSSETAQVNTEPMPGYPPAPPPPAATPPPAAPQGGQNQGPNQAWAVVRGVLFALAAAFIVALPAGIIGAIIEGVADVYSANGPAWGLSVFGIILLLAAAVGFFVGLDW